ncbi:nicotinate-nucleotide pyrophosphorylase [Mycobacterium xenopi 3993]|nr:nicotinate-nucleotide pyrophosphorylase [Mycobacterium xenopi 3993]
MTLTARAVAAAALARDESRVATPGPTTRTPHPNRRKAVWFGWPTTRSACTSRLWRRCADDCGGIVGLRPGRSSRRDTTRPGRGFTLRTGCDHVGNRAGRSGDDRVAGDPGTGVIAGVDIALLVLEEVLDGEYRVLDRVDDGARLQPGSPLLVLEAPTRGLLTAERTMLNLVGHLSGIATTTAAWVDAVRGPKRRSVIPARRCPGCGRCRSTRCASAGCEPSAGPGRCRADQGQPRRRGRLGGGGAARSARGHTRSAVRSGSGFAGATRRGAGRKAGVGAAGQLCGVADPDRGAASRCPRCGYQARVLRGSVAGQCRAIRRHRVDFLAVGALTHSTRVLDIGLDT